MAFRVAPSGLRVQQHLGGKGSPSLPGKGGKGPPVVPLGACEEDRTNDWYCSMCRERNFAKRLECFKCRSARPKDGESIVPQLPQRMPMPASGSTVNGMVKSYNKRGFGFIMIFGIEDGQDIYYTRENVSPRLLHPDMPGEQVTFELQRECGRLVAKNIRPLGEDRNAKNANDGVHVFGCMGKAGGKDDEDRSRDWCCSSCGERNFLKRMECHRCKNPRDKSTLAFADEARSSVPSMPPRRTFSPHAGSRAVRESLAAALSGSRVANRSESSSNRRRDRKKKDTKKTNKKRRRSSSKSDGSSSSSGRSKRKRRRTSSSDSSCKMEEPTGVAKGAAGLAGTGMGGEGPEIEKAKAEALEQLIKLQTVEPREVRMTEWRALLRHWHPDKNPERVEVATAVFQFLQKGKPMLDA